MRFAGRIEPGSGGGIFTGQRVLFFPARIALTRAMLSLRVRPATEGTVIGGSLGAESFAAVLTAESFAAAALTTGFPVSAGSVGGMTTGVEVAAATVFSVAVACLPPGGTTPSAVVAPASLVAP